RFGLEEAGLVEDLLHDEVGRDVGLGLQDLAALDRALAVEEAQLVEEDLEERALHLVEGVRQLGVAEAFGERLGHVAGLAIRRDRDEVDDVREERIDAARQREAEDQVLLLRLALLEVEGAQLLEDVAETLAPVGVLRDPLAERAFLTLLALDGRVAGEAF